MRAEEAVKCIRTRAKMLGREKDSAGSTQDDPDNLGSKTTIQDDSHSIRERHRSVSNKHVEGVRDRKKVVDNVEYDGIHCRSKVALW